MRHTVLVRHSRVRGSYSTIHVAMAGWDVLWHWGARVRGGAVVWPAVIVLRPIHVLIRFTIVGPHGQLGGYAQCTIPDN